MSGVRGQKTAAQPSTSILSNAQRIVETNRIGRVIGNHELTSYYAVDSCPSDECRTCRTQFPDEKHQNDQNPHFKYTEALQPEQAKSTIADLKTSIEENHRALESHLARCGDAILKRWKGFGSTKRRPILKEAFPNIANHRWAYIDDYYKFSWDACKDKVARTSKQARELALLPWLNAADLQEDFTNLLQLLHVRITHAPWSWIQSDLEQIRFGRDTGILETRWGFGDGHSLAFGVRPETWGEPCALDLDSLHCGDVFGFPIAELVFEAQSLLYDFLRRVVETILKGEGVVEGDAKWLKEASKSFPNSRNDKSKIDVGTRSRLRPYLPPPQWDTGKMATILQQARDDAEAELIHLQTDPIQVQAEIAAMQKSKSWPESDEDTRWHVASLDLFEPALRRAIMWDAVAIHIQIVNKILERRTACKGKPLPKDLVDSFGFSWAFLQKCATEYVQAELIRLLPKYGAFELKLDTRLKRQEQEEEGKVRKRGMKRTEPKTCTYDMRKALVESYRKGNEMTKRDWDGDKLLWAVTKLCQWEYPLPPLARAAGDYLVELRSRENVGELNDTPLSRIVDTLEILHDLMLMHEAYSPGFWQRSKSRDDFEFSRDLKALAFETLVSGGKFQKYYTSGCQDIGLLKEASGEWSSTHKSEVVKALKTFVSHKYPKDKSKPTESTLEQAIECRKAMKAFWKTIREAQLDRLTRANTHMRSDEVALTREITVFTRTFCEQANDDLKELEMQLAVLRAKKAESDIAQSAKRGLDTTTTEAESLKAKEPWGANDLPSPSKKPKLQKDKEANKGAKKINALLLQELPGPIDLPDAELGGEEEEEAADPNDPDDPTKPPIQVNKRSYALFAKMWPVQSKVNDGKSYTFSDLIAAMSDAGMNVENIRGSHHTLKGSSGEVTIPAPHGRESVRAALQRQRILLYGCTLKRALGWGFERFEERKK